MTQDLLEILRKGLNDYHKNGATDEDVRDKRNEAHASNIATIQEMQDFVNTFLS